ncbi:MAG: hypothetical protein H6937_04185 [Burkholderiales bacterium]|nr:hypothetical protein [Burkholderiales bacterium]MDR4516121.1 hypothetical protein [Nitrosomonas sp.]
MRLILKNTSTKISKTFAGFMTTLLITLFFLQPAAMVNAEPLLSKEIVSKSNTVGPLDDPWFKFCLTTAEPEDLDACINGWPANPGNKNFKLQRSSSSYELVLIDEVPRAQNSVFVCPHEFGPACDDMVKSIVGFGGTCVEDRNNTICEIPQ